MAALFSRWHDRTTSKRNREVRLELHENGLVADLGRGARTVHYERTSLRTRTVQHTGIGGYTIFEYELTDVGGQELLLRGRLDFGTLWLTAHEVGTAQAVADWPDVRQSRFGWA